MSTLFGLIINLLDQDRHPAVYFDLDLQTITHVNDAFKNVFKQGDLIESKMIQAINQQLEYAEFKYHNKTYLASFLKIKEDEIKGILIRFGESYTNMLDRYIDDFFFTNATPCLIIDDKSSIKAINRKFEQEFDVTPEDLIGRSILEILSHRSLTADQTKQLMKLNTGGVYFDDKIYLIFDNDIEIPAHLNITPLFDYDKYIGGFVTAHSRVNHVKLSLITDSYRKVVKTMSDAIIILDDKFEVIYPNQTMIDLVGYSKDDLVGKPFSVFDKSKHEESFESNVFNQVNKYGDWQGETWITRKDNKSIFVWLKISIVTDLHKQYRIYVATYRSLLHQKENPTMLQYFAQKDALTSLYNRFYFNNEVTEKLESNPELVQHSAFIDMEHFKRINDYYGHMFGDDVLVRFGQIINSIFSGHLTARYGGDEFVVYFNENVTNDDLVGYQRKFDEEVDLFFKDRTPEINVTASFGIATFPMEGTSIQELINAADKKMYNKKRGKTG